MAVHRSLRRAAVPITVAAGVAAVGVGVWPALANEGGPELPDVTARELVVRIAESETAQLSGTVRISADLGVPDFGGLLDGAVDSLDGPAGRLASLATGEGRVDIAVDGPDRQRLTVSGGSGDSGELELVHDGEELWVYDSASATVLRGEVPADAEAGAGRHEAPFDALSPQEAADLLLDRLGEHADITVDGTARVAGRDAYRLLVEPHDDVLGEEAGDAGPTSARISVDAETGVPLAVTVRTAGDQTLDVAFSRIDYAQPAGSVFDFTPPSGARVIDLADDPAALEELLPEDLLSGEALPEGFPDDLLSLDPSGDSGF
ncbi:outer membrane lipoprotein carrier protein LolA [Streptomyces sp. NPDC049879]|uniref:outer membrane lipoprotein carrier protein LolA n=1 Tax=Streptomyces sp. NPDC049879 TaxID=3365598 RepID=UPI00379959B0